MNIKTSIATSTALMLYKATTFYFSNKSSYKNYNDTTPVELNSQFIARELCGISGEKTALKFMSGDPSVITEFLTSVSHCPVEAYPLIRRALELKYFASFKDEEDYLSLFKE